MSGGQRQQSRILVAGFALVLVFAWLCYRPALSGDYQLDDLANLGGLAKVRDFDSGLEFVISGEAGPAGRPIALVSFALQADSWAKGASDFLRVNFLLHLLNAVLVAFAAMRVALAMSVAPERARLVAVATASSWVLMPLLATSSMLVVQRMTTLSATFVLLGLCGYLLARARIAASPRRAMTGMSISLVVATTLATLTKESGLLLPVYALVLEATVLVPPGRVRQKTWLGWQTAFLLLPLLLIVAYLATRVGYPDWIVERRGFTAGERLLSEARLLWAYLGKAVLGLPDQLGIFQDVPQVSRSLAEPTALLAAVAWLMMAGLSIAWRRRYPLVALAVLWYLAGHLLESTVVPLELYFEHRNYLPIVAPLFALCACVVTATDHRRRIGLAVVGALVLTNAYFLFVFASLWGEPSYAARHWAMRYPNSVRAVGTLASYQLQEEGPLRALQTIDQYVLRHPQHAYLRIQELNLLCRYAPAGDRSKVMAQLRRELPAVQFTYTAGTMLSQLLDAAAAGLCPDVAPANVATIAGWLRANPRYAGDPLYNQFHAKLLAGIARIEGDHAASVDHLQDAIAHRPSTELNMMMVTALAGAGDFDAANKFIDDARNKAPANPLHAFRWQRDLDGLRTYVAELEKVKQ